MDKENVALIQEKLRKAYDLMGNSENAANPWYSVCGLLPAGGIRCEELADEVRDILGELIAMLEVC